MHVVFKESYPVHVVFKESYPVHVVSPAAVIVLSITVVVLQLMIQLVAPTLSTANSLHVP